MLGGSYLATPIQAPRFFLIREVEKCLFVFSVFETIACLLLYMRTFAILGRFAIKKD